MSVYKHYSEKKKQELRWQFVDFTAVAITICRRWCRHTKVINVDGEMFWKVIQ